MHFKGISRADGELSTSLKLTASRAALQDTFGSDDEKGTEGRAGNKIGREDRNAFKQKRDSRLGREESYQQQHQCISSPCPPPRAPPKGICKSPSSRQIHPCVVPLLTGPACHPAPARRARLQQCQDEKQCSLGRRQPGTICLQRIIHSGSQALPPRFLHHN